MHDDRSIVRKKQNYLHSKRGFFSTCRDANLINFQLDEDKFDIIKELKEKYKQINIDSYVNLLDNLKSRRQKQEISSNDALVILVEVIDPDYKLYNLYKKTKNLTVIKKEMENLFDFFDEDLLNLELKYKKYKDIMEKFSYVYKNEA